MTEFVRIKATGPNDIFLGAEVEDVISGFKGLATIRAEHISGMVQFAVQPRTDDPSKCPEALFIDWQSLDIIGEGIKDRVTPYYDPPCKLGDFVQDPITKVKGTVSELTYHLNGCVVAIVLQEGVSSTGKMLTHSIHANRLVVKKESKPTTRTGTGGSSRSMREVFG